MEENNFPQPQIPVSESHNPPFFSRHLKLILVVLATAVIASGATYAVLNSQKKLQSQPQPVATQPLSPTPDLNREPNGSVATANWKTYNSLEHIGPIITVTFQYPPSWNMQVNGVDGAGYVPLEGCSGIGIRITKSQNQQLGDIIFCYHPDEINNESLVNYVKRKSEETSKLKKRNEKHIFSSSEYSLIDADEIIKRTTIIQYNDGKSASYDSYFFIFIAKQKKHLFDFHFTNTSDEFKKLLPVFLSTFRFN